jgi:hypothetical protein
MGRGLVEEESGGDAELRCSKGWVFSTLKPPVEA